MKNTCPFQNQCQATNLIYGADVQKRVNNEKNIYSGLATTTFKERLEIIEKTSTASNTTKTLSCRKIYGDEKMRK